MSKVFPIYVLMRRHRTCRSSLTIPQIQTCTLTLSGFIHLLCYKTRSIAQVLLYCLWSFIHHRVIGSVIRYDTLIDKRLLYQRSSHFLEYDAVWQQRVWKSSCSRKYYLVRCSYIVRSDQWHAMKFKHSLHKPKLDLTNVDFLVSTKMYSTERKANASYC